jgi:hypothetical protein
MALAALCSLTDAPALAQTPYVAGAILGEVTRSSRLESETFVEQPPSGDGEVFGFAVRAGTSVGERWGVELEFVRPSELEQQARRRVRSGLIVFPDLIPTFELDVRLRQRISSLDTLAWLRQRVADKVDLVYLAGAGFHHVVQESRVELIPPRLPAPIGFFIPSTKMVSYHAGPVVGFEARIALTDHVTVTPGVRLNSVAGAWVIRAGAGVGWTF